MTAHHACLSIRGEQMGDLISVGARRVTLFTVRVELRHLDGITFESARHARIAVATALGILADVDQTGLETPASAPQLTLVSPAEADRQTDLIDQR